MAVRADKCRIAGQPNGAGSIPNHVASHVAGPVLAVECQGAAVRVVVCQGEADEAVALVPDSEFHAAPIAVGDPATLCWSAEHAHPLA